MGKVIELSLTSLYVNGNVYPFIKWAGGKLNY